MFAAKKTDGASAGGSGATYVEDVFSTYLYSGTGAAQTVNSPIPLGRFPSVYQNNFANTAVDVSIPTRAGDWVIVYAAKIAAAPTCSINGSSVTASSTLTDVNAFQYGVFLQQATSSTTTVSTNSINFSMVTVIRGPSSVTVGVNFTSVSGTNFSTAWYGGTFSSSGWAMLLLTDRDPAAAPTIDVDNGTFMRTNIGSTNGAIYGINGNGTSIPARNVTNLDASTVAVFCMLNCVGSGTTVSTAGPATDGGMVWLKGRSGATDHALYDTARGATLDLVSNSTAAQTSQSTGLTTFNSAGFSIGALAKLNTNAATYTSWTFRKQPKFFDVVTYTGNGANRTIAHSLGSAPGCIIVKRTDAASNWQVYHRNVTATSYLVLNTSASQVSTINRWNNTEPTSTVFSVGTDATVNANGGTYVAYLFAHNAGGFGLTGNDNVISCGGYVGNGSTAGPVIQLGYEPQWLMIKAETVAGANWEIVDSMRGLAMGSGKSALRANLSDAEISNRDYLDVTPTGFAVTTDTSNINGPGERYIYIAIRRPMRPPTTGTQVLDIVARTGTGANATVGANLLADAYIAKNRGAVASAIWADRLRGAPYSLTNAASAEASATTVLQSNPWDTQTGVKVGTTSSFTNASGNTFINYLLRRAPGAFDVVCYTGTGANRTVDHNLGVAPELMLVKVRSGTSGSWRVYSAALGATQGLLLNGNNSASAFPDWNSTAPTSSVFSLGTSSNVNGSTFPYVAYLFATRVGVTKVGSYTGNGTNQTIDCGFAAGARFVLIKRTNTTGSWYVWDSVRGIISGNDPYFAVESGAAEVTSNDSLSAQSSGFGVIQNATTDINVNGHTYIYLAIA